MRHVWPRWRPGCKCASHSSPPRFHAGNSPVPGTDVACMFNAVRVLQRTRALRNERPRLSLGPSSPSWFVVAQSRSNRPTASRLWPRPSRRPLWLRWVLIFMQFRPIFKTFQSGSNLTCRVVVVTYNRGTLWENATFSTSLLLQRRKWLLSES